MVERPVEVFDQMLQTCGVMLYSQSYLSNVVPSMRVYKITNQVLKERLKILDEDKESKKENSPRLSQLVQIKLILTSMARNHKKYTKLRPTFQRQQNEIINGCMDMLTMMDLSEQ